MEAHEIKLLETASDEVGKMIFDATGRHVYRTGGWVRDKIMRKTPKDIDMTSGATPEQILAAVPGSWHNTEVFPRIIVVRHGHELEIPSLRGYRPGEPWKNPPPLVCDLPEEEGLKLDAFRRDLTINSMFEEVGTNRIIDFYGGQEDIKKRIIRTTNDPVTTFLELKDKMIRAVRFACQYDFELDPKVRTALQDCSDRFVCAGCTDTNYQGCNHPEHKGKTAAELHFGDWFLVTLAFTKILTGPQPARGIRLLRETGMLSRMAPELEKPEGGWDRVEADLRDATVRSADGMFATLLRPFVAQYGKTSGDVTNRILRRWGLPESQQDVVRQTLAA